MSNLKGKISIILDHLFIGGGTDKFWYHRDKSLHSRTKLAKVYHRLCYSKILYHNGAFISETAKLAEHIIFPHGISGVFISQGAVIGKNCTMFQQVTVGSNTLKDTKKAGAPVIGNNAYIGAGAKIIGGIKVGNNVRIGANCVVVEDIPDNSTVVMDKPRIIRHTKTIDNTFERFSKIK